VPNRNFIPNLPDGMVVEVPAMSNGAGVHPRRMQPLPEPIAAMIRLQGSINKLLVEAFAEQSKDKLLQAVLLEPTVTSYRGAVEMVDEMLALQRDVLPPIH
jgi:alpha-galactosidase